MKLHILLLLALVSYFSLFVSIVHAESSGFGPATTYPLNNPASVKLADLDSDGFDDMVVTLVLHYQVYVYMNNGDGSFASPVMVDVGYGPYHIEPVDVDNDGDLDLVTANLTWDRYGNDLPIEGENISVLINNGDATFQPVVNYGVGPGSDYVHYGDFDGDGDQDLVSANTTDNNVLILNNNGDGTFVYDALYDVGYHARAVRAGDIDSDGDVDIVTSTLNLETISLLLNNGSGVFDVKTDYHSGEWPHPSALADFDGSFGIDAIVPNHLDHNVSVFLNDGTTLSPTCKQYQVGEFPGYSEYGDIDLDGDLDVIVTNVRSDNTSILINQGDGTFNGPLNYDTGDAPLEVAISDLDNDGDLDMAVANYFGDNITVRLNQRVETGTFPSPATSAYVSDCDTTVEPLIITTQSPLPSGVIGEAYDVTFTATGGVLPYTWSVHDGSLPSGLTLDSATGELSGTPTTAGTYGFTVIVTDSGGRTARRIYTFDPPPSGGSSGLSYNQPIHIDPNPHDTGQTCSNYSVVSGELPEGLTLDSATGVVSGIPTDDGSFEFTVACTIDNGPLQGQSAYKNFTIVIVSPNQAPDVDANGPYEVSEGDEVSLSATGSDPDGDVLTYKWDLDNNGEYEASGQHVVFPAAEIDGPSAQLVHVRATDPEGLFDEDTTEITVNNVDPSVGAINAVTDPFAVDTAVSFSAEFTDPGIHDTHTAVWDWGDGNVSPGTIDEIDGSGSVSDNHTYSNAGVYTIQLTVTDDDNGQDESTYQYVVVCDPEGGFVTGGGWIDSPLGAYIADPLLTGKANFGFVSKYKKGAAVPTGQTEFQFEVGDLNFHSTSYDRLVIAGPKAMYKGNGTINGTGSYAFQINAIDGQINGGGDVDQFRIKIKKADGGVIYDNQPNAADNDDPTTTLGGGSIKIHKGQVKSASVNNAIDELEYSLFLPVLSSE